VAGKPAAPEALNRYSYAGNNPANWTDPSGLCVPPLTPVCAIGAAAAGGAAAGLTAAGTGLVAAGTGLITLGTGL
jgi:hypothetical protein